MRYTQSTLFITLFVSSLCLAATHKHIHEPETKETKESEFKIDKSLLDDMYQKSVTEVQVETRASAAGFVEVSSQFSMLTPTEFELSNSYFRVPYSGDNAKLPMFHLVLSTPLTHWGELQVDGILKGGFTYREALTQVQSTTGLSGIKDIIKLQWIPISLATRLAHPLPYVRFVKPFLSAGAGAQWLNQEGKQDGISQGFWVPFYSISGGVTLFDQSRNNHWFGGVALGVTTSRSFSSLQTVRYWSLDIAASFAL